MRGKKTEALKLALEFAKDIQRGKYKGDAEEVITAIRKALAEPEMEPAFRSSHAYTVGFQDGKAQALAEQQDIDWKDQYEKQKRRAEMWIAKYEADIGPLKKAGPVEAQQQEPVAFMDIDENGTFSGLRYWSEPDNRHEVALYTSPQPSKPWVGLNLDDREKLRDKYEDWNYPSVLLSEVDNILREKNT